RGGCRPGAYCGALPQAADGACGGSDNDEAVMNTDLPRNSTVFRDPVRQTGLESLVAVNWNRDDFNLAGLRKDVMTPSHSLENPSLLLEQPAHLLAGDCLITPV